MHPVLQSYFEERIQINKERLKAMSPFFTEKTYRKNEFLLREGEVCNYNYFVIKGCLRLYSVNKEGAENTRYFAFEGKFGTCFTSLINRQPAFEYIQCLEKTTVLSIHRNDFYHLVETEPAMNFIYRNIL